MKPINVHFLMSSRLYLYTPNEPGPRKYKKLRRFRSSNRKSPSRRNQNKVQSQVIQNCNCKFPPIRQPNNQMSTMVTRNVMTVAPEPIFYNQPNLSNSSTNQNKIIGGNQEYSQVNIIGKGAFGVVYSAIMANGKQVAIKKVSQNPKYKNHEHEILKMINNKYCVKMINSFKSSDENYDDCNNIIKRNYLNIVMNYMPHNLHDYIQCHKVQNYYPPIIMAKLFAYQIFLGLSYLHSPRINITHRDLKPRNVLVDPDTGELKICDFGSAKILSPKEPNASYIASRYYRAPELIMKCTNYTNKIDIWAAGCIFAEILTGGVPLFQSNTSRGQLGEIFKIIGHPTTSDLESFQHEISDEELIEIKKNARKTIKLDSVMPPHVPPDVIELLNDIFQYNPQKRPSANQCLYHRCFGELFRKGTTLPNGMPIPPIE